MTAGDALRGPREPTKRISSLAWTKKVRRGEAERRARKKGREHRKERKGQNIRTGKREGKDTHRHS